MVGDFNGERFDLNKMLGFIPTLSPKYDLADIYQSLAYHWQL